MPKPSENLRAAKALIDTPETWTKFHYAYDRTGQWCELYDDKAVSFCALGALARILDPDQTKMEFIAFDINKFPEYDYYIRDALIPMGSPLLQTYNDDATHSQIMSLFDRAIELAEAEGQ